MRKKAIIGTVVLFVCLIAGGVYVVIQWFATSHPPASEIISFQYSTGGFGNCEMFSDYTVDLEAQVMVTKDSCWNSEGTTSTITQSQVDAVRAGFEKGGVRDWQESYINSDVMDGWGFTLNVTYKDGSTQVVHASNKFPPRWEHFEAGLKELGI